MKRPCPGCGVTVELARDHDTNEVIPLEIHTDEASTTPRYRVRKHDGEHAIVEKVDPGAPGPFQPDHRPECPGYA